MDIGSILLLLALVILVGAYIASPLRGWREQHRTVEVDLELSQLLAERERILEALAELDFDNEMGKVPDDLYPIQREALVKRGADVLRLLDQRELVDEQAEAGDIDREERLERAAKIRSKDEDSLEALIAAHRAKKAPTALKHPAASGSAAKFCSECGAGIQPGDRFCPSCGNKLS